MIHLTGALNGQRVLVVGGVGEGIGRAITRTVAAAGARSVAVVGRNPDRARIAAEEIAGPDCGAIGLAADVRSSRDTDRVVGEAVEAFGGIDVLVTVVGGFALHADWKPVERTTDEDWDLIMDINLTYVFRYVRAVAPVFTRQRTGGSIVSIGSLAGVDASPRAVAYGAAKAGLINLAKTVSTEQGREGVRMNVLNCGLVDTEGGRQGVARGLDVAAIPLARMGDAAEIAQAVVFLASPLSGYISGQALNIDGAVSARSHFGLANRPA